MDSIEEKQVRLARAVAHQPLIGKRFQQMRPSLKLETLDRNSELDERDLKSPNLVI